MLLDGARARAEDRGDVAVRLARRNPVEHLALARREQRGGAVERRVGGQRVRVLDRDGEPVEVREVRARELREVALAVGERAAAAAEDEADQEPPVDVDRHRHRVRGADRAVGIAGERLVEVAVEDLEVPRRQRPGRNHRPLAALEIADHHRRQVAADQARQVRDAAAGEVRGARARFADRVQSVEHAAQLAAGEPLRGRRRAGLEWGHAIDLLGIEPPANARFLPTSKLIVNL